MRISDWSSDVCSSDLPVRGAQAGPAVGALHEFVAEAQAQVRMRTQVVDAVDAERLRARLVHAQRVAVVEAQRIGHRQAALRQRRAQRVDVSARHLQQYLRERAGVLGRSEEHTSELQSLMRISLAVFCFKKKIK